MTRTRKIALLYTCGIYILAAGCAVAVGIHMWLVYAGGQNMNTARQTEEEIYNMRGEIVQIASTGVTSIDTQNIIASHLVVAEPMTVSVSR